VSDEQVIAQASKAHLVRERSKTVSELSEQFTKFSKNEVQHFHKLEQQRKVAKSDETTRSRYNDSQCNYLKYAHNIDSNGCGLPEN
jgi:inorganic pyrophosphatase